MRYARRKRWIGGVLAATAAMVLSMGAGADVYTLDTCPITGAKLGSMGPPLVKQYDKREVRFCCKGCVSKFEADKEEYLKAIDAKVVKQQKQVYPLDVCLVTGEKLGEMGPPVDVAYNNRLVRFCCKGCVAMFNADPAKYLKVLDKAVIDKQGKAYPLDTCPVTGDKLDGGMGKPIDYVVGNHLIRLCCKGCVREVEKDPVKYLAIIRKHIVKEDEKEPVSSGEEGENG